MSERVTAEERMDTLLDDYKKQTGSVMFDPNWVKASGVHAIEEAERAAVEKGKATGREETELEDIKAVCPYCESGNQPFLWMDSGEWFHDDGEKDERCLADPIYERRRLRAEQGGG